MSLGLLGKKLGMTRLFDQQAGSMIPVTVIDVSGNTVLQTKTPETDGYTAVQIGFGSQKEQRVNKPDLGRFKKAGSEPKRFIKEFRLAEGTTPPAVHPELAVFTEGQWVDVIGTTIGKGFQGVYKRHNFGGLKATHGSMMHRRTGSIGCRSTPGRVWKNQKMPGHMGQTRATVQNLKIVAVRPEDGVILIAGPVPGSTGSYLTIRPAKKKTA
jgi:large subunit ribosomal protein L3